MKYKPLYLPTHPFPSLQNNFVREFCYKQLKLLLSISKKIQQHKRDYLKERVDITKLERNAKYSKYMSNLIYIEEARGAIKNGFTIQRYADGFKYVNIFYDKTIVRFFLNDTLLRERIEN